jgi:hypothetical protein
MLQITRLLDCSGAFLKRLSAPLFHNKHTRPTSKHSRTMTLFQTVILASMPFIVLGINRRTMPDAFGLYAYSDGFGGLPLFYADGKQRKMQS